MEYQSLGQGKLRVSALCLATRTLSMAGHRNGDEHERNSIFDAFIGAGGNFIDATGNEAAESGDTHSHPIADLIAAEREHLVIASGCRLASHIVGPGGDGSHRKTVLEGLDVRLSELRTDYLDLYWVHNWDYFTPAEEVMRALADVVTAGKVRHVGIATSAGWIVNLANTVADWRGWPHCVAAQAPYNLVLRDAEQDILNVVQTLKVPMIATSPLAGGILAGRASSRFIGQRERMIIAQLEELAGETGYTPAQIALTWLRHRHAGALIPLLNVDNEAQLRECLDYEACSLTQEQMRRLEPNLMRPSLPPSPSWGASPSSANVSQRYSPLLHS